MAASQKAEEQAKREAMYDPSGVGTTHGLEWMFMRKDIPQGVKQRFWVWSSIKDLRLSNLLNIENANTILSQLNLDINWYLSEKKRKGEKLSEKILSWLNQLKVCVRLNILASLGEERDMELITKSRGEWKSEIEQKTPPMEE